MFFTGIFQLFVKILPQIPHNFANLFSRYRSKPEIPAVVPGMGNNYKPGQQKKTAPPGKDTEYYV